MICFRFSSESSGKIEIGSRDLLDEGIGAVGTFTSAGLGVVDNLLQARFFC